MAGEMSYIKQTGEDSDGNIWSLHAAIAKAVGGQLKPFDQYQGPYIVIGADVRVGDSPYQLAVRGLGVKRLWVISDNDYACRIYREDTDKTSDFFYGEDESEAIRAAKSLL